MELEIWHEDAYIALVTQKSQRMALKYTDAAGPLGSPLISVAMPVSSKSYGDKKVRAYLQGLLPEGEARRILAYDFNIDASDDLSLLAIIGRDCAGALQIVERGDNSVKKSSAPVSEKSSTSSPIIGSDEIERRIRDLPIHPLGIDQKVRLSLAGVQPKLLLTKLPNGGWTLPTSSLPSTHILKPAIANLPHSLQNEAFCVNFGRSAGLHAANTSLLKFGSTEVLASERYDRVWRGEHLDRIHQEDSCQALSVVTKSPQTKYEEFGGPRLRDISQVLDRWGSNEDKKELLRQIALHIVVGNCDAHGKNISFLHNGDGTIRLSPIYDVMSTEYYRLVNKHAMSTTLGLFINGKRSIEAVTFEDMAYEARSWKMRERTIKSVLFEIVDRLPDAVSAALRLLPETPAQLVQIINDRIQRAKEELTRIRR